MSNKTNEQVERKKPLVEPTPRPIKKENEKIVIDEKPQYTHKSKLND